MTISPTHGRPPRLTGWDYTNPGPYFVTFVTRQRKPLLGSVVPAGVTLSSAGDIVQEAWQETELVRPQVGVDCWVVMPDHTHAIVLLRPERLNDARRPQTLGGFISGFKATTAHRINAARGTLGHSIWAKGYYDRVIRNERELDAFRTYIQFNPSEAARRQYQALR